MSETPAADEFAAASQRLFELSPLPMVIYDGKCVLRVNDAAARVFRLPSTASAIGREIADFVHPDSMAAVASRLGEMLAKHHAVPPLMERFVRDDGTVFDGEATATPVPWRGGTAIAVVVVDISERLEAQAAVREAEHRYRSLFDTTPDPVIVHDGKKILLANHAAVEFVRSDGAELVGRSVLDFVRLDQQDRIVARMQTMLQSGRRPPRTEVTIVRADGSTVEVDLSSAPFMLEGRRVVVSILRDISESKRAEAALRESEERFRSIVESAPVGMHLYDLESDGTLRFVSANPAADRILGIDHTPLFGLAIEDAFPGLIGTDVPGHYRSVAMTGKPWTSAQVNYDAGDISGAFEVRAFRSHPKSIVVMFTDITERLRGQVELERDKTDLEGVVADLKGELERARSEPAPGD